MVLFKCKYCGKTFDNKWNYVRHSPSKNFCVSGSKTSRKSYVVNHCGITSKYASTADKITMFKLVKNDKVLRDKIIDVSEFFFVGILARNINDLSYLLDVHGSELSDANRSDIVNLIKIMDDQRRAHCQNSNNKYINTILNTISYPS